MAGALADIFAAVRLALDGTGFEAQATALATKSGQNAGTAMSQQLSSKLKSAVGAGIGMAAGAAFSMALTGANQLDAATKQLQADTGMTAEAAKLAEHAIAGMYQNNLQGFDQIGKTMAVVINGLDLTGAAADAMTEKFLKFETATGQDSAAVSAFHEILNAWDLDASAVPHLMDLLVASHQKYGSSIADNQASLQRLAPQMKAMNMTVDDTVNLLNLFDAAGLDASKAQFALNTAVKNLKPGQTFNDLIAQVTAIEDPTLRAQEAIKLFGARGGVGLANALKPGITSLSDFATSATDTAGATDKAAAAVESGFGEQAKLKLKEFQGALAEIGTNMGDLVMVAALLGPGLTRGLLAGIGGLAGFFGTNIVPQLAGALTSNVAPWMTAGTKAATIFGSGMTMALPLIAAAAVVAAWAIINDGLNKQADAIATHTAEFAKTATVAQLKASRDAIAKGYQDIANLPMGTLLYGDQLASLKRDFDAVDAAIAALDAKTAGLTGIELDLSRGALAASRATTTLGTVIVATGPKVDVIADAADRAKTAFQMMGDKFKATWSALSAAAQGAADAIYGPAMRATAAAANAREIDAQKQIIAHHNLTTSEQKSVEAQIITQQRKMAELRKNHASAATLVNAQIVLDKLREKASGNVTAAEKLDAATRLLALQKEGLGIRIEMAGRGELTKTAYAALISELQTQAKSGNLEIANSARIALAELAQLKAAASAIPNLPPWLARSYSGSAAGGRASGGPVTAGMPYIVNENTARSEWFVPNVSGTILTAKQAESQGAGRGGRTTIVNIAGLVRAETPEDVARVLRRAEAF